MMMGRPQGRGPAGGPAAGQRGGPFMGLSMPVERSKDFRGTLRKLLRRLRPEWLTIAVVLALGSLSVAFAVIGPKITGNAMNIIFDGVVGKSLPAGLSKPQLIELLRARGQGQLADMLTGTNAIPGVGVDFTALAQVLAVAVLVYVLASLLSWAQAYLMAGVAQRTVYGLRREVEEKLARLPLRYFDSHASFTCLGRNGGPNPKRRASTAALASAQPAISAIAVFRSSPAAPSAIATPAIAPPSVSPPRTAPAMYQPAVRANL